jgi:hypothetical protein
MKYIISESAFSKTMVKYFEMRIDKWSLNWYNPTEEDDNGHEYEDDRRRVYYVGPLYDGEELFRYYDCDWFEDERETCPLVSLEFGLYDDFNDMFSDLWYEPFREWIEKVIGMPVKYIER